jgi:outer membrane protein assembly factor BamB
VTGDPVVQGGTIFAGNAAGRVYAVRASNGETIWSAPEASLGAVIVAGGSVFTISDENRLVRLDAATGARIWSVEMPFFTANKPRKHLGVVAHYGPVMAGGRIVVASGDGLLRLFDPASGAMVASAEIPGGAASAPALAGGMLYVVGGDGQLHAFR